MKNFKKMFFILVPVFVLFIFNIASAKIALEVPIPGMEGGVKDLGDYIRILYNYGIYAASIMAVIMISINSFKWVSAGGNKGSIEKAKSGMLMSITGLFLLFASYMILNTVNSQLILLKMPYVEPITSDFLELETESMIGLDPDYYDETYVADYGHESEGGGNQVAVQKCGTASQQLGGYFCVPFSNNGDFEYEFSGNVIGDCPDMEQCVTKSPACSNGNVCTAIGNCSKYADGYCDGVGSQVCCKKPKQGIRKPCQHNADCISNCCCDHPWYYKDVCNSKTFCYNNGMPCIP